MESQIEKIKKMDLALITYWCNQVDDMGYKERMDTLEFVFSQQQEIGRLKCDKWISVEDRMPEDFQRVLVVNKGKAMKVITYRDKYNKEEYWGESMLDMFCKPTHWQPLPDVPKE